MADPFVAEIRMFPFNFAPRGWAFCDGQILPISQNTALFSLLGVNYGGNGTSNFGLPNLQGRAPLHPGQGPGLSDHVLGESGGESTQTLVTSEIPAHTHALTPFSRSEAVELSPAGTHLASGSGYAMYLPSTAPATHVAMSSATLATTGSGAPHNNMMPYLTLNFCIALQGVFPQRP